MDRRARPLGAVRDYVSFRTATAQCGVCKNYWHVDLSNCRLDTRLEDVEPRLACIVCANTKFNIFVGDREVAYPYVDDGHSRMRRGVMLQKKTQELMLQPAPTSRHPLPDASTTELQAELKYRGFTVIENERVRKYGVTRLVELSKGKPQTVTVIMPDRRR